jgi:hypothetical protein
VKRKIDHWPMGGRQRLLEGSLRLGHGVALEPRPRSFTQVQAARAALTAAAIGFFCLSSYSPELSAMEPIWHTVKCHELTQRSYRELGQRRADTSARASRIEKR